MSDTRLCPFCNGEIKAAAIKCKHCKLMIGQEERFGQKKIDEMESVGKIVLPDGAEYIGQLEDSMPHGEGSLTAADGSKYVGEFRNGIWHGQGTFTGTDGTVIKGRFNQGEFIGEFEVELIDGTKYFGEMKDVKPHGHGEATWPNGSKYIGQWENSKPHGQGTVTMLDGQKYVGEWKDGSPHGQGTMSYPNGKVENGKWEKGKYLDDKEKKTATALLNSPNNWFAAEDENYHYICNTEQSYSIYRISKSEGESVRLNEDEAWYLNLSGDWLYYCNKSDQGYIYKIKKDGTERSFVCEDSADYLNVDNGWLYYCNKNDNNRIYKIKSDGSNRECLSEGSAEYLCLHEGWLVYASPCDGGKIYKLRNDGSESVKLGDDKAKFLSVMGEWVYFSSDGIGGRLYKIHLDGVREFCVTDDSLSSYLGGKSYAIDKNWVYYINKNSRLYKVRLDGTEKTKLNDNLTANMFFYNGYVYYSFLKKLSRVKLDGTCDQVIFESEGEINNLVLYDGYFYYQNGPGFRNEGDSLIYRIKIDGTGNTAITSEKSEQFQIDNGWVYYKVRKEGGFPIPDDKIYRVKFDGKDETTLFTEKQCYEFVISNNIIFYKSNFGVLKLFNMDEGNKQVVVDASVGKYLVFGDHVLFYAEKNDSYSKSKIKAAEKGKVYITDINNLQLKPLFDPKLKYGESREKTWIINNKWLYYQDNIGRLCRIRLDGRDNTRLTENTAVSFLIKDNLLYYINSSDNDRLYRSDLDGSNNKKVELNNERSENIITTEDYIYYVSADKDNRLFRIKPDGKGNKKVIDKEIAFPNCLSDSIYYINNSQGGKLYCSNMTGKVSKVVDIEEFKATKISDDNQLKIGNTTGNIANFGIAAIDGDWLYYNDGIALYKEHINGSGQKKLVEERTSFLNVIDDWIYYASSNNLNIYKISIDGSGKTVVNSDKSTYLNVIGEWIYYVNESDDGKICKIRTDGSGKTRVSDVRAKGLSYNGQWLVFINLDDASPKVVNKFGFSEPDFGRIYKMKPDGSDLSSLNKDETELICVSEDWVYYISRNDNHSIYRLNINTTALEKVNELKTEYINFSDGWIYFVSNGIKKIRSNGTGLKKVYKYSTGFINVVGEWIYFLEDSGIFEHQISRIRTDGSGYAPLHTKGKGAKHIRVKFDDGKSYIYRTLDLNIKLGSKVMVEGIKAGIVGQVIEEDAKYNKNADAHYISEVVSYGTGNIDDLSDVAKKDIEKFVVKKSRNNIVLEVKKSNRRNSKPVYCKTKDLDIGVGTVVVFQTTWMGSAYNKYKEEIGVVTKRRVKGIRMQDAYQVIDKFPEGSTLEDVLKEKADKELEESEKFKSDLVQVAFIDNRKYSYKNKDPKLNIGSIVQVTRGGKSWEGKVVMMNVEPKPTINYLSIEKVLSYGEDDS